MKGSSFLKYYQLYLLLLLPICYFLVFKYLPMYGTVVAFKDYNIFKGVWESKWIGLEAFERIFKMKEFYRALRNTFMLNFLDLLVSFPAPIMLALLLNEVRSKWFKRGSQTLLYIPHFISWVIISGMVYRLAADFGIINNLLAEIGIGPIQALKDNTNWVITYVLTGAWQSIGWGTIIYLAALTGINPDLYEAASVDGAGKLSKMWNITVPGIMPTIMILLVINIGHMAAIGLERPYTLGNLSVVDVSDVISTFVYRVGIQSTNFTVATAVGLFQGIVSLLFLVVANRISNKLTGSGLW